MSNKLERFTQRARRVLSLAQEEAERMHHGYIGTEHLLLGLMREEGGVAGRVLRELGLESKRVQEMIERLTGANKTAGLPKIDLSPGTKRVLELAVDEARRMGHHYIGTEHLLLGLVRQNEGVAVDVLKKLGITAEQIRKHTRRVLQENPGQAAEDSSRGRQETPGQAVEDSSRGQAGEGSSSPTKVYSLAFLGFGNVGKALIRLLQEKKAELRERYGIEWKITGVASRRTGWLVPLEPEGFPTDLLLTGNFRQLHAPLRGPSSLIAATREWLAAARPDVVFELTSMNPLTGQPAIDYIKAALEFGAHVITANKGPVVHAYHELRDLAAAKGKRFLFEATVMGGAPIFSLFREALPAANLIRFRGILNSTTNLIITEMENGLSFDEAVKKAQDLGIAETDPSADVDGWDAAVKVSALATVLMDVPVKPQDVNPRGIRELTPEIVQAARKAGRPYKLICRADKVEKDGRVVVLAGVNPEQVEANDPLASVNGASSMIQFQMDTLYSLTLSEQNPDVVTTAYGPLADFITIARARN